MTIACSTTAFTRLPLAGALQAVRQLGFEFVDILAVDGWAHVLPSQLASDYASVSSELLRLLEANHLRPLTLNTGVAPLLHDRSPQACAQRQAQMRALMRLARDLELRMVAMVPREPDPDLPRDVQFAAAQASLRELLDIAGEADVTLAMECHIHSLLEGVAPTLDLLAALPELRIAYDPSHWAMQGIALEDTLPLLPHVGHVHLRDAALHHMQVPFGHGQVDFGGLLAALRRAGYRGDYSIEYLDDGHADVSSDILALRALLENCR